MEQLWLALHAISRTATADARHALGNRKHQQNRHVWHKIPNGERIRRTNTVLFETAADDLIGVCR